jgi:hypothetical protein
VRRNNCRNPGALPGVIRDQLLPVYFNSCQMKPIVFEIALKGDSVLLRLLVRPDHLPASVLIRPIIVAALPRTVERRLRQWNANQPPSTMTGTKPEDFRVWLPSAPL